MKKLLIAICIALSVSTVYGQGITLNGYSQQDASDMVNKLIHNNTSATKTTSVWFNSQTISAVVALMNNEKKKNPNVDGIRIYYGTDKGSSQNTVILVSTYYAGIDTNTKKKIHQDYFDHDTTDLLFSIAGRNGYPSNLGGKIIGADLYSSCNTPCLEDQGCPVPTGAYHYITRKHAEDMVHTLSLNEDTIDTKAEWFPLCLFTYFDAKVYDGMRVYYSKHPLKDKIYPGRDALVIEFTKDDNGNHRDAFDCIYAQCTGSVEEMINNHLLNNPAKTVKEKNAVRQGFEIFLKTLGVDNGELCPNNCSGTKLP